MPVTSFGGYTTWWESWRSALRGSKPDISNIRGIHVFGAKFLQTENFSDK